MRLIDVLVVAIILIVGALAALLLLLMKGHQSINNNYSATDPEVFSVWDETKPLHRVDPIGLEILHQGHFTIYFPSQYRPQAEEVAQALSQVWQVVKHRLGLGLGDFSVVLVLLKEDMGGVFIESWPRRPIPLPLVSAMKWIRVSEAPLPVRLSLYAEFPHEAAHIALGLEWRWLEEGIAEYISLMVVQELAPDLCEEYRKGRQEQVHLILPNMTYDLTQDPPQQFRIQDQVRIKTSSPQEIAGYGFSLAFWLQIARGHGEAVIRQFLEQAKHLQQPSKQELARILSELTGEDVWGKLQRMNLHDALQTLEHACEAQD